MKNSYTKKLERKKISIRELEFAPEQRLGYQDAMELVRKSRREGQYAKGQYVLEQICEQVKFLPEPQLYLMNIYLDSMSFEEARVIVEQLLKKFPRDISVLTNCATFFLKIYDTATALALLDRAAAIDPRNDKIPVVMARVHLTMGNSEKARACYGESVRRNPRNVTAMCAMVPPYDNPMEQPQVRTMLAMLENRQLSIMEASELHFALAKAFSRVDKDRHFDHLHAGNKIVSSQRPFSAQHDRRYTEQIIGSHCPKSLYFPDAASGETLSPIFIAAMARSGTTMLEQMLGCHSEIRSIGESAAFGNAFRRVTESTDGSSPLDEASSPEELSSRIEQIALEFKKNYLVRSVRELRLVDKSIGNFYYIGDILTVFPRARIIDLRRHPLDVIYSCYSQYFSNGNNYAFNLSHLAERYKNHRKLMDYWCSLFPDHILPVSYESLVSNPEPALRNILDFCNLEWEASCLQFHDKSNVVHTASLEQVRKPLYKSSVYKWEKVKSHLEPAITQLGKLVDYHPVDI